MSLVYSELRMRSAVADDAVRERLAGRVLGPADFDVLLTGPTRVRKPDGRPLCVYLPGAMARHSTDPATYEVLHGLRNRTSSNRGAASGTRRIRSGSGANRSYAKKLSSSIIGAIDPLGQNRYCRLTSWTGQNLPEWRRLHPMLSEVGAHLAQHVPDRYAAQLAQAQRCDPAWVVPGTPFSTVTVNNTYPTGVHKDQGDLDAGFSTITVLRRGGAYTGGQLVFPAYRVAVDLRDGDLLLMDAHDWHGNVPIVCGCGATLSALCPDCNAERISVVAYFRTKIADCGTPEQELNRARDRRDPTPLANQ